MSGYERADTSQEESEHRGEAEMLSHFGFLLYATIDEGDSTEYLYPLEVFSIYRGNGEFCQVAVD